MAKLKMEVWKSSMNQTEIHHFMEGKGEGYQNDRYVFGYNPTVIKPKYAKKILEYILRHLS